MLQVMTTVALDADDRDLLRLHSAAVPRQGDQLFLWNRPSEFSVLARVVLVRWEIATGADRIIPGSPKSDWDVTLVVEPWDASQAPLLSRWEDQIRNGEGDAPHAGEGR